MYKRQGEDSTNGGDRHTSNQGDPKRLHPHQRPVDLGVSLHYPEVNWSLMGMQPLRVALIGCVAITAVGGILSNPLFQWANTAVAGTPLLQQAIALSSLKGLG